MRRRRLIHAIVKATIATRITAPNTPPTAFPAEEDLDAVLVALVVGMGRSLVDDVAEGVAEVSPCDLVVVTSTIKVDVVACVPVKDAVVKLVLVWVTGSEMEVVAVLVLFDPSEVGGT